MKIAVANSRMAKKWINREISWGDFKNSVSTTKCTTETVLEYSKMKKSSEMTLKMWAALLAGL